MAEFLGIIATHAVDAHVSEILETDGDRAAIGMLPMGSVGMLIDEDLDILSLFQALRFS